MNSTRGVRPGPRNLLTDVEGLAVGQAEDAEVLTGTTVVLVPDRAVAAVDQRGGGPGTRETDALDPASLVGTVDAVVLSGGSVYGLDAASGVTAWLGARGRGFNLGTSPLVAPIVPAAILFDLANGGAKDWGETPPYAALGRAACKAAGAEFRLGNAGAGYGAKAGQVKGGIGSASAVTADGFTVGALVAVNAFGSAVVPGSGALWAAAFEMAGEMGGRGLTVPAETAALDPVTGTKADQGPPPAAGTNTTIGVVATDADLTRAEAERFAIMAGDGFARALRPVHAPFDGDTLFALATAKKALPEPRPAALMQLGAVAADCVARAIGRGVYEAETLGGMMGYRDATRR